MKGDMESLINGYNNHIQRCLPVHVEEQILVWECVSGRKSHIIILSREEQEVSHRVRHSTHVCLKCVPSPTVDESYIWYVTNIKLLYTVAHNYDVINLLVIFSPGISLKNSLAKWDLNLLNWHLRVIKREADDQTDSKTVD